MNGLWTAEFGSSVGIFGGGVVVLQDGRIFGGDGGYYYIGDFELVGNALKARIKVAPFVEGYESVFKSVGRPLTLILEGTWTDETHAVAQGYPQEVPSLKLGVKLTKRA